MSQCLLNHLVSSHNFYYKLLVRAILRVIQCLLNHLVSSHNFYYKLLVQAILSHLLSSFSTEKTTS